MLRAACVLVLLSLVQLQFVFTQEVPHIACPQYFKYDQLDGEYYGRLTLPSNSGHTKINVHLSQRGSVDSDNYYITFLETESANLKRLAQGKPLRYFIAFPTRNVLPKVILISFNDEVICSASQYPPPNTILKVELQHTLQSTTFPQMSRPNVYGSNVEPSYRMNWPSSRPEVSMSGSGNTCGREGMTGVVPFITGGSFLTRGQFPWLTAIYKKKPGEMTFICGGSLISSRTVISAGHCFRTTTTLPVDQIVIHLGSHDLDNSRESGAERYEIQTILIHPDYNMRYPDADLGLLQTKTTVGFTQYIKPICLWNESDDESRIAGVMGTVAGWGGEDGAAKSQLPKMTTTRIVSRNECVHRSDEFQALTSERTLCAGNRDGTGPCMGDSGGGLMIERNGRWMLRAIVSAGQTVAGRCHLAEYVIYCDVAKHMTWVTDNTLD